ncbi:hypothetical protein HanPI659440_Chr03g0134571 [Helianthus annuus]|nr:hypothetical protein HanPI659440_Chr03g0134571 [Helianthus annuus]
MKKRNTETAILTASFCISSFISALLITTFLVVEVEVDNDGAAVIRSSDGDLFPSLLISAKFSW